MWFRKIRYLCFAYVSIFLTKILKVDVPPATSSTALIKRDDKFLCLKLSYHDGYGLPGGLVNGNENLEETLIREVKEETGFDVQTNKYLGSVSSPFKSIPSLSAVYAVTVTGEQKESKEGSLHWLTKDELIAKLYYSNARLAVNTFADKV